jgi:hypothetical protein
MLGVEKKVCAADSGLSGARDTLDLRLRPEAVGCDITIEIKRSADNQEWATFVRRAQTGGYDSERV